VALVAGAVLQAEADRRHPAAEPAAAPRDGEGGAGGGYRYAGQDPPCFLDGAVAGRLPDGKTCVHNGGVYLCTSVPNAEVATGNEPAPAAGCLDGDSSWGACDGGRFLCAVGAARPWEVDPVAWAGWQARLAAAAAAMEPVGRAAGVSWERRLAGLRRLRRLRRPREETEDRDPDGGGRFPTAAAMREAKLRDWLRTLPKLDFAAHVPCRQRPASGANHGQILIQRL
jgi:hypothetical protein